MYFYFIFLWHGSFEGVFWMAVLEGRLSYAPQATVRNNQFSAYAAFGTVIFTLCLFSPKYFVIMSWWWKENEKGGVTIWHFYSCCGSSPAVNPDLRTSSILLRRVLWVSLNSFNPATLMSIVSAWVCEWSLDGGYRNASVCTALAPRAASQAIWLLCSPFRPQNLQSIVGQTWGPWSLILHSWQIFPFQ